MLCLGNLRRAPSTAISEVGRRKSTPSQSTDFSAEIERYVEPFIGGAVFFHLKARFPDEASCETTTPNSSIAVAHAIM
jgi:hypothetical protein